MVEVDICQVNSVGTSCAQARGKKAHQLCSFLWLQATVSQFVFFFPQNPLGAPFRWKRAERKFRSKIRNEGKIYVCRSS